MHWSNRSPSSPPCWQRVSGKWAWPQSHTLPSPRKNCWHEPSRQRDEGWFFALEMRDRAAFNPSDKRRYRQTTKIELLTVQTKAHRVYQAPLPSRTLELAPFWGSWHYEGRLDGIWPLNSTWPGLLAPYAPDHGGRS